MDSLAAGRGCGGLGAAPSRLAARRRRRIHAGSRTPLRTRCRQLCTGRSIDIRARFAEPLRGTRVNGPGTLCYVRAPGRSRPSLQSIPSLGPAEEVVRAPVSEPDPATIWHRFRTEARHAVSESTWHIWLERVSLRELAGTTLVLEAPDDVRTWVETRFARLLVALRRDRPRPGRARGDRRARGRSRAAAPAPRGAARRARAGAQPAPDLRPVRDRRLQPARPRRRARRRRDARPGLQPALHLRPARARQDPPAALDRQLRARARRRPDRPLHDRRGLHRPLRRRAPGRRAWRRSRRPTAASTSCSSTTSSSCRARPRPSRSSSTPSTRCTRPAPSSC